jgi:hypothetical protein
MRKLYIAFPKSETLSNVLTWSHYFEILRSENELEISFYIKQTETENWSVRELKRQMKSMLFHRVAIGKNKKEILKLSKEGIEVQKAADILKDPLCFRVSRYSRKQPILRNRTRRKTYLKPPTFLVRIRKRIFVRKKTIQDFNQW